MTRTPATLWPALASGDFGRLARDLNPAARETEMDVRTPPMERAEAKLDAEIVLTDELRRRVADLPGSGHPDFTARDIALGITLRTFASPRCETERKMLAAMREALWTTDPEKEIELWEAVEMAAHGMRRAAEEREAASRDPITGRVVG